MAAIIFLFLGVFLLYKLPTEGLKKYDLLLGWGIKLLFGFVFMVVYSKYYGLGAMTVDWEEFIHDSIEVRNVAHVSVFDYWRIMIGLDNQHDVLQYFQNTNHWSAGDLTLLNDSRNVLRVNSLIVFFSGGNLWVHIMVFSLLSLIGFRDLFLGLKQHVRISNRWLWYGLIALPSIGFWSTTILKEPLMLVGFCLLLRVAFGGLTKKQVVWRLVFGTLLMICFKPYVLLCFLGVFLLMIIGYRKFKIRLTYSFPIGLILAIVFLYFVPIAQQKVVHHLTRKQFDFINVGKGGTHLLADSCYYLVLGYNNKSLELRNGDSVGVNRPLVVKRISLGMSYPFDDVLLKPTDGPWPVAFVGDSCGSFIDLTPINNSYGQLLKNIPEAFVNGAFRPFFGDPGGNLKYLNILETLVLFGVFFYSIFRYWKYQTEEHQQLILFLVFFSCLLFILIGWITPVLGAIARYRVPAYLAVFIASIIGSKKSILKHE
jgi:hypothetical protein